MTKGVTGRGVVSGGVVPLPALPLAAGAKMLAIGHQVIGIGDSTGGLNQVDTNTRSPLIWARNLDNSRVNMDTFYDPADPFGDAIGSILTMSPGTEGNNGSNRGVEGDTLWNARDNSPLAGAVAQNTPGILARLPEAFAHQPAIMYFHAAENDIEQGRSAAEIVTDYDQALSLTKERGIWVILSTLQPSWPNWDASKIAVRDAVQTWILAQSNREGVKLADMRTVWPDANSLLERRINQVPRLYYDSLNYVSAYKAAKDVINPLLATMVQAGTIFSRDPSIDNLFPASIYKMNGGTAGVKSPTTAGVISGNIATSFTLQRVNGASTAICSLEADGATDRFKQVIQITAADSINTNQNWRLHFAAQTFAALGLVEGDWVRQMLRIELDGWKGWRSFIHKIDQQGGSARWIGQSTATLIENVATVVQETTGGAAGVPKTAPGAATIYVEGLNEVWLLTEPQLIGKGNTSFRTTEFFNFFVDGTAGGAGTIKVSAPIIRKVLNPVPNWRMS